MSNTFDAVTVPQQQSSGKAVLIVVIVSIVGLGLMLGFTIVTRFWVGQYFSQKISKMEIEAGERGMLTNVVQTKIGTYELENVKYDQKRSEHETYLKRKTMLAFKVTGSLGEGFLVFEQDEYDGLGMFYCLAIGKVQYK